MTPERVWYDTSVMARLMFPMPEEASPGEEELVHEARGQLAEELRKEYGEFVEDSYLAAQEEGIRPGPPPNVVALKIAEISTNMARLEEFRTRLLVFARVLASDVVPARLLAERTGISHSTIVRMATPAAIEDVASEAGPVAALALEDLRIHDDPEFFARLRYVEHVGKEGV